MAFEVVMAERGEGVFGLAEVAQRDGDAGVCIEKSGLITMALRNDARDLIEPCLLRSV